MGSDNRTAFLIPSGVLRNPASLYGTHLNDLMLV